MKRLLPIFTQISRLPIFSGLKWGKEPGHSRPPYKIENENFIVEASVSDGSLDITDKKNHQIYHGLNRFIDGGECGDLYNYCPPPHDQAIIAKLKYAECERGSIAQKMRIRYQLIIPHGLADSRKSRSRRKIPIDIECEITLVPGLPRIDISTQVDNQACDHRLRVHFPAPFWTDTAWYDGHFEIIQRPVSLPHFDDSWEEPPRPEVPQREFTSVTDGKNSLTIANHGLPEVEVLKNSHGKAEIAITLLRSVGWLSRDDIHTRKGHAGPMGLETPEAQMPGKYNFAYAIIPGGVNWRESIHLARGFNAPMLAVESKIHVGNLYPVSSMVENLNKDFMITAIKLGEEDTSLIVRGYNIQSFPVNVSIKLWRAFAHAYMVNLEESIQRELPISKEGEIKCQIEAHKIATFRFSG